MELRPAHDVLYEVLAAAFPMHGLCMWPGRVKAALLMTVQLGPCLK